MRGVVLWQIKDENKDSVAVYGIAVPVGRPDPDIVITVTPLNTSSSLALVCNPGFG